MPNENNVESRNTIETLRAEIKAQTEAVRADEKQRQENKLMLLDLHRRIGELVDTSHAIHSIVLGMYLEQRTLEGFVAEVLARAWGVDRAELVKLRQQLTDTAFQKLSADGLDSLSVKVEAGKDAAVKVAGRDSKEKQGDKED